LAHSVAPNQDSHSLPFLQYCELMMFVLPALALAALTTAFTIPPSHQASLGDQLSLSPELYLVELNPGETRWITEDEKWELKRVRGLSPPSISSQLTGR
jgi:hypothetical protein